MFSNDVMLNIPEAKYTVKSVVITNFYVYFETEEVYNLYVFRL